MDIERVVVFGHKPANGRNVLGVRRRTHTHSYIHGGYVKGFAALGFETYWLDEDSKELDGLPTKGTLFFTEDQVDENIPLSADAYYITHSSSKSKYEDIGAARLNLCNFVADLRQGVSFNYPGETVERIDDITYVDAASRALYQPWATNLLPHEIDADDIVKFDANKKVVNYVGTIGHDNIRQRFNTFKKAAARAGVKVQLHSGVSDADAMRLVRDSIISVDLRGDWHLERGYVPCRLWKNLSYGMHVGSNSLALQPIFQGHATFEEEPELLYEQTISAAATMPMSARREAMLWIKDRHTFLHRAETAISTFRNLQR